MAIDGRRPRGSYRCGCGTRVQVAEAAAERRTCWWTGCRILAATEQPISLCGEHEAEVADKLACRAAQNGVARWHAAARAAGEEWYPPLPEYRELAKPDPRSLVYFMRRERLIKIGTTIHLARRAQALNAAVLATIPGSYSEEAQLHRRFSSLNAHGEWFQPGQELLDFINAIRRSEGTRPLAA